MAASIIKKGSSDIVNPSILCLYGELGTGKTTFTQGFAKGLGIATRLISPTFIIVRRYAIPKNICFFYHIDLYRIKNEADFTGLGLGEIFSDPNAIIIIEWAERLGSLLPSKRIDITLADIGNDRRGISLKRFKI